jgi:hypothetical protein
MSDGKAVVPQGTDTPSWCRHRKTTLNLDDELIRRRKRLAGERGTTLAALVERALRAELARAAPGPPFVLHLPTVRGDRLSSTDPADRDALNDLTENDGATR